MLNLKDKIIFISGASSGIGEATAKILAKTGARLILAARRLDRLQALANSLKTEFSTDIFVLQIDISEKDSVNSILDKLPEQWQAIDILINNAGLALSSAPFQQGNLENWDRMIDTNLKGLLYITRLLLPGMLARNSGHIINLGSVAGQNCYQNGNVYCATKHAVRAISESLRLDIAGAPVRVTEIAPGAVETEFSIVRWNDAEKAKNFYHDFNPLEAEDIAEVIYFCLTRPLHVDITSLTLMPTTQAACSTIYRNGRKFTAK